MTYAEAGLPRVGTRQELLRILDGWLSAPMGAAGRGGGGRGRVGGARHPAGLKSYVLETRGRIRRRGKAERVGWIMYDTGVSGLKIATISPVGGASVRFYADVGDGRLVTLHTNSGARDAGRAVAALVDGSSDMLDNVWLHRGMLERVAEGADGIPAGFPAGRADGPAAGTKGGRGSPAPDGVRGGKRRPGTGRAGRSAEGGRGLGGGAARGSIRILRGQRGGGSCRAHTDVSGTGYFAAKRGGSVQDHLGIVEEFKEAYSRAVSRVEECRLGATDMGGGRAVLRGQALNVSLPLQIADVERLIDRIFVHAKPFQLSGIKSVIEPGYYRVLVVDLRTGDTMTCEVASGMMRIYLPLHGCGSTVMRLLANLQASYGTGVRCMEVDQAVG